jgi:hypothetical protein
MPLLLLRGSEVCGGRGPASSNSSRHAFDNASCSTKESFGGIAGDSKWQV